MKMNLLRISLRLVLPGIYLMAFSSCIHYQRYSMAKSRLQKIDPESVSVYILDGAHPLTRGWYMSDPVFSQKSISGFISRMEEIEVLEVSTLRDRSDGQHSRNDILIYAKPQFALTLPDTATLTIYNTQLEKVEVCELDYMRTFGMPMMGCTGLLLLAYLVTGGVD